VANVWQAPNAGHLPLDPSVWPTAAVSVQERLALVGHMPTQVLYGERVKVLARHGGWSKIAVPDQPSPLDPRGYPGWVRSWQLGPAFTAPLVVTARSARLANGVEVGFASQVPRDAVPASATRRLPVTRADLVRTAERFLGLHYLWGGLSAWGFDCSGLIWDLYRAHGLTIPRDADPQMHHGTPVGRAQLRPGDLLFFGSHGYADHVTLYLGGDRQLEAPDSAHRVRISPVRWASYLGARRYLSR
jgi:cell wall-associated NlpC family hydrolase